MYPSIALFTDSAFAELVQSAMGGDADRLDERSLDELPEKDLAIVDVSRRGGWTTLRSIKGLFDGLPILAVGSRVDPMMVSQALSEGASGVIASDASADEVARAVQIVLAGGSYLGPDGAAAILGRVAEGARVQAGPLTGREMAVLGPLSQGLSARQIARALGVSERTVNTHVANIYRKLGVGNRVEAVRVAIRMGMVRGTE